MKNKIILQEGYCDFCGYEEIKRGITARLGLMIDGVRYSKEIERTFRPFICVDCIKYYNKMLNENKNRNNI